MKKFLVINLIVILAVLSFATLIITDFAGLGRLFAQPEQGADITITYHNNFVPAATETHAARTFLNSETNQFETDSHNRRRTQMLGANTFTRDGFNFAGWQQIDAGGISVGDPILANTMWLPAGLSQNTSFIALWNERIINQLDAPTLHRTGSLLTWNPIPGNNGYRIYVNGVHRHNATVNATSFNLNNLNPRLAPGTYSIHIVAVGVPGTSTNSLPSNIVTYVVTDGGGNQQNPVILTLFIDAGRYATVQGYTVSRVRYDLTATCQLPFRTAIRNASAVPAEFAHWTTAHANGTPTGAQINPANFLADILFHAGNASTFTIYAVWRTPGSGGTPQESFVVLLDSGAGTRINNQTSSRVNFTIIGNSAFPWRGATHLTSTNATFLGWYWEPTFQTRIRQADFLTHIRSLAATNSTGTAARPATLYGRFQFPENQSPPPDQNIPVFILTLNAGQFGRVNGGGWTSWETFRIYGNTPLAFMTASRISNDGWNFVNWVWDRNNPAGTQINRNNFLQEARNRATGNSIELFAAWQQGSGNNQTQQREFTIRLGINDGTNNYWAMTWNQDRRFRGTDELQNFHLLAVRHPNPSVQWTHNPYLARPGFDRLAWTFQRFTPNNVGNFNVPGNRAQVGMSLYAVYELARQTPGASIHYIGNHVVIDLFAFWQRLV